MWVVSYVKTSHVSCHLGIACCAYIGVETNSMVRKAEDVNAHMGPICDAKDMLDPKLWMRKSIESLFLFGIVDDESPTCAIPRNGVLKKHMTRSRYTVETILMGSKVWCWRLEGHIITQVSRCIDFVGKNTKNKRLYLNRPQIAWKGISHFFSQFVTFGEQDMLNWYRQARCRSLSSWKVQSFN